MKGLLTAMLCVLGLAAFAQQVNLAPDITKWPTVEGLQHIEQGAGIDGEPALVYERKDKNEYKFKGVELKNLKSNTRYRCGVYVKTVDMPRTSSGATFAIEYSTMDSKYAGGVWPDGTSNASDWTKIEASVTCAEGLKAGTMLLYMRRGASGKAYFSRPYIYEDKPLVTMDIISPIQKYAMHPGKTDLEFGVYPEGIDLEGKQFNLTVKSGDTIIVQRTANIKNKRLTFTGLEFGVGDYVASIVPAEKYNIDDVPPMTFRVIPADAKPAQGTHITVDEHGRVIIDGKPFMPIGMYVNLISSMADMSVWHNAGFNCMMPYNAIWGKSSGKRPTTAKEQITEVLKVLDDLNEQGIKILFSLKDIHPNGWTKYGEMKDHVQIVDFIVNSVKHHPAIMGWYLNDEIEQNDFYRDFRRRVSTADPFHPTFQVQCRLRTMGRTVGYADVFMVDPYPFNKADDGAELCRNFMKMATSVFGKQVMSVPQCFPTYQYQKNPTDTFFPTNEQMRGHILLEAAMGSKGFIFYTYESCMRHKAKTGIDRWPDIVALSAMLHDLEPFIMSIEEAPKATVKSTSGIVYATPFKANGKVVAVLAGVYGKCDAEITIPGNPNLKSRFGLTKNLGNGRYQFTSNGCDGDILE